MVTLAGTAQQSAAHDCPTSGDQIETDRPDVTNSPIVVPRGSFQAENGVTWIAHDGSDVLDAAETQLRLGVADCVELVITVPTYFYAMNGQASSGFDDVVSSFKWELPVLYGFVVAAAGGLEFPSGRPELSGRGYDPYIQGSWSREIGEDWGVAGMFTVFWLTSQSAQNPTFEPTFEVERDLTASLDSFVEYVGDYPSHMRPSQVIDAGATWLISKRQQADFHFGFGLNRSSPDHFLGVGYSFRLDGLF